MLANLFRRIVPSTDTARQASAQALYAAVVAQARQPVFYAALGVPDTVDGRFEMVALHACALVARLDGEGEEAEALNQALFDAMFTDVDENLRELGVGDLKVGKKIREMSEGFHGRAVAFEKALEAGDRAALADVIDRNTYHMSRPEPEQVNAMAMYLEQVRARLAAQQTRALVAGVVDFGPAPVAAPEEAET